MNNTIWQVTELSRSFAVVFAVVAVVLAVVFGYFRLFSVVLSRFKSLFGYLRLLFGHNSCNWHVTEQLEIALKQCKSPLKQCLTHVTSM